MSNSILIVEDNSNLGNTLKEYLTDIGHNCSLAQSVKEAKEIFFSIRPQIVIMDIGLPDGNGIELAKELRSFNKNFVLLFLSALNDPETRVEGLEIGAEDYITKPFALKELILRLERISERQSSINAMPECISHGKIKIWFNRFEVLDANNNIIMLSQKECAILELLYREHSKVVDRNTIISKIWGDDNFPSNRTVDNYIVKLRKWCESDSDEPIKIISVRGVGYKLTIKEEE